MNQPIDKLPWNDQSEQVVLGLPLLDNTLMEYVVHDLEPKDFYIPWRGHVFRAMQSLYSMGRPIDPITIHEELKRFKIADSISKGVLGNLTSGLPLIRDEFLQEHAKIVRDTSIARKAIRMLSARIRDLLSEEYDVETVIAEAEAKIVQLNTSYRKGPNNTEQGFAAVNDIVPSITEQFDNYNKGVQTGVKTGMRELDTMLDGGGLQSKATYLVSGIEKSGKTSLALGWGGNIAINQNKTVPIVTLEMSKETLTKRLYSQYSGIPYYMFRPGFHGEYYEEARKGLIEFAKFPFQIADNLFHWSEIRRYCERMVESGIRGDIPEVGAFIFDYAQLITMDVDRVQKGQEETTAVSRHTKMLASDLDKPVILMSSLSRQGLTEGQEPDTFNLRGSQALAYDAEAVMFIHDPAYKPGKAYVHQEITDMVLILNRQRNGPTGRIPLKRVGPCMKFLTEEEYRVRFNNNGHSPRITNVINGWDEDDE